MTRTFALLLLLVYFSSCNSLKDYYSGIVADELDRPVAGVLVKENLVAEYAFSKTTDANGYFKFKRNEGVLPELILSKEGFITDTIYLVFSHAGESLDYSPVIKADSTKLILKGRNTLPLAFQYHEIEKPVFNTITSSKFKATDLYGVWLVNGDEALDGFQLSADNYYAFGYSGNRYMRYIVNAERITIFKDDYYYSRTGIIKSASGDVLEISWDADKTVIYTRWKP